MFCAQEPHFYRVRKAKARRPSTVSYKRLSALSKQMSHAVQVHLVKGIKTFRKKVSLEHVAEAFKKGSYGHIIRTIPWDQLPEHLEPAFKNIDKAWHASSKLTISHLPPPIASNLRFDTENKVLKKWLDKRTGDLIVQIDKNTQEIVQRAVQRSFTEALTPDRVAGMIRDSIGLDPRREQALVNYENMLYAKGQHTDKQIDVLVDKYNDRLLDQRAMCIARTETRFANNQAQLAVWREGSKQGLIGRTAKKVWYVDGNPCELCEPMDGVAIGLDEVWTLDNGDICEIPTDSHPNCFCGMELEFGEDDFTGEEEGDAE